MGYTHEAHGTIISISWIFRVEITNLATKPSKRRLGASLFKVKKSKESIVPALQLFFSLRTKAFIFCPGALLEAPHITYHHCIAFSIGGSVYV